MLGFRGRIGRLRYFLLSMALGLVTGAVVLTMVLVMAPLFTSDDGGAIGGFPLSFIITTAVLITPIYWWFALALGAKRFRDMGWSPLPVMVGWGAITLLAPLAATWVREDIGGHVALAANVVHIVLGGCLLFWPGKAGSTVQGTPRSPSFNAPDPVGPLAARAAAASALPAGRTGFGRRGF